MLVVKDSPIGVDKAIQQKQVMLYKQLEKAGWSEYDGYGRAYRNRTPDRGFIAEAFVGGGEYKEIFWDDRLNAISFFFPADSAVDSKGSLKQEVALIFFVNVDKLKPSTLYRNDEEIRQEVLKFFGSSVVSIQTGVDNVLREFSGSRKRMLEALVDMHPRHCFRINFNLIYTHC
jgi:hypothetical protein